jgi:hypothetical protein
MHAVEAHDSGCGGQPEVARVVLYDGVNRVLRHPLLRLPICCDVLRQGLCMDGSYQQTAQQTRGKYSGDSMFASPQVCPALLRNYGFSSELFCLQNHS